MHLNAISNGLGAPSMLMLWLAAQRLIPGQVSITADTGSEVDRRLNTGEIITAREFFDRVVMPISRKYDLPAYFVRAKNKHGVERVPLWDSVKAHAAVGIKSVHIPLFGSDGGRLSQSCTENWKVTAINQCGRSLGAKSMMNAQGVAS